MFNFMRLPPLRRLMLMKAITGGGSWSTIVGNPVSFTAKAAPLRQLKVAFSPVQEGSGDPSPDNVRPISGWDGVEVWRTGKNLIQDTPRTVGGNFLYVGAESGSVYPFFLKAGTYRMTVFGITNTTGYIREKNDTGFTTVINNGTTGTVTLAKDGEYRIALYGNQAISGDVTGVMLTLGADEVTAYVPYNPSSRSISISFGSTLYSGTLDVLTGVVTVDGKYIVADENTGITFYGGGFFLSNSWTDALYTANADVNKLAAVTLCDTLKYDASIQSGTGFRFTRTNAAFTPLMFVDGVTSKAEAQAWLADHNVSFFYPLANPITIQLTPQEVESLAGDNTMWSNANQPITVEYRKN